MSGSNYTMRRMFKVSGDLEALRSASETAVNGASSPPGPASYAADLNENPVNAKQACVLLGQPGKPWGHTRVSAIKKAMGITNQRYFFLSDVRKFLRENPNFRERDVYGRDVKIRAKQTSPQHNKLADRS